MIILIIYYAQVNEVSGKGIVLNILLIMIEKFKEAIDRGNDLYKIFDCINHSLLIAKMYNYGLSSCLFT